MHPNDEMLRSLTDRELHDAHSQQVREHLLHCPACQSRLGEIQHRSERVWMQLNPLSPGPRDLPRSPQSAYKRFTRTSRLLNQRKESLQTMFNKRPLWTTLAVLAILALALSLTPVQAWASSFLSLFRVQKITIMQFDPSAVKNSRGMLEDNQSAIEQVFKDDLKIKSAGERQSVTSVSEAASAAGFTPRLPAEGQAVLVVQPGFHADFTIDQPKLQALMDSLNVDAKLPASVNGKVATADVSGAVQAVFDCPTDLAAKQAARECTTLLQVPSPVINTPAGLDVPRLGQAMFQFLGLPADEARQLSQRIDWATTLVVPIPQSSGIAYQDVQVDGVSGSLILDQEESSYLLMWVKDGMVYSLRGQGNGDEGLKLANSLK